MTRYFIFLVAAFLICNTGPSFADSLVMKLHMVRKETVGTDTSAPSLTQRDFTVTLFPQIVDVRSGNKEMIYNFDSRQIYAADYSRKTLTTYPLCAIILSRQQDKERELQSLLKKQGTSSPAASPDDAIEIDMRYGGSSTTKTSEMIHISQQTGQTSFSAADRPLAVFSHSSNAIPEDLRGSYAHFLLYETNLHPVIWQSISSADNFFTMLNYTFREKDKKTEITMTLTSVQQTKAVGPDVQGLAPEITGDKAVDGAIVRSAAAPMGGVKGMEEKIGAFLKQKDSLRAGLAAKVLELSHGSNVAISSALTQEALKPADSFAASVFEIAGNQPRTTEQFIQNMGKLNQAKEQAPDYAYLIEYFRATQIRSVVENRAQRSPEEENAMRAAFDKLSGAIVANPWLTGAYCDLGDAYFNAHEIPRALLMWEQAARLNESYPGLQRAWALQQQAQKDFPEYF
ncbi:MAG: hypothetical protein ACAH83_06780 [Alphaproteobacteria bacterium]